MHKEKSGPQAFVHRNFNRSKDPKSTAYEHRYILGKPDLITRKPKFLQVKRYVGRSRACRKAIPQRKDKDIYHSSYLYKNSDNSEIRAEDCAALATAKLPSLHTINFCIFL